MAEWKCLTAGEEALVQKLGWSPEHLVVNRVGDGHLQFLDMRSRAELMVTIPERGHPSAVEHRPEITPPRRSWM